MNRSIEPLKHLYSRLANAGFSRQYIQKYVLPQDLANDDAYEERIVFISTHLGITEASLHDESIPLAFNTSRTRFFRGPEIAEDFDVGLHIAEGVVRVAIEAIDIHKSIYVPPADILRRNIIKGGNSWVSFQSLLDFCWNTGIPVLHIKKLPSNSKKLRGQAIEINGYPAIVLGQDFRFLARHIYAFAHEIGHLAQRHLGFIGLMPNIEAEMRFNERTEMEAHRYAMELITGGLSIPPDNRHYRNVKDLVAATISRSKEYQIDPGYLIVNRASTTNDWQEASIALNIIEGNVNAPEFINTEATKYLRWERISPVSRYFLQNITGIQIRKDISYIEKSISKSNDINYAYSSDLPNDILDRYHELLNTKYTVGLSDEQELEFKQISDILDEADWNSLNEKEMRRFDDQRSERQIAALNAIIEQLVKLQTI